MSLRPSVAVSDPRRLWVHDIYRGDDLSVRPFGRYGVPRRSAWLRITHFWRSRAGERIVPHPRLLRTLVQVQRHLGARRLDLLSGYRAPVDARRINSYHHMGKAADLSIDGIEPRELFEYCRRLQSSTEDGLGCGLYPNRRFVHLDARSRSVIWVDLGHRAYVSDAASWLREHPEAGR
jgi:uncharacterized protein YcbK (DUF882 family)